VSPRTSKQNSRIRDERREQILHAALKVFARCGFAAARMTDIAAEAGISTGLAYHYFASKEDLFHELVALALNTSLNVYEQAHASKGSA